MMAASPRKRVLIVEDDPFLRKACRAGLAQDGYDIADAEDGEEALRQVQADPPDVLLLDWLIPKVPGLEVLRAVKADARSRDVPVLILSNSSRDEDRDRAIGLGAADYLIKADLSLEDLRARVRRLVTDS